MKQRLAVTLIILGLINLGAAWLTPNVSIAGWAESHRHIHETYNRLIEEGKIIEAQPDSDDLHLERARIVHDLTPSGGPTMYLMLGFLTQGILLLVAGYKLMSASE